jgi:hypothetical protein
MKFFGKDTSTTLGAAMTALVDNDAATAEQVDAANQELATAGIKGAQLVPGAVLDELTAKAGRVDAAEKAATEAAEKVTTLEASNEKLTASNTKLTDDLAKEKERSTALGKKPGADATTPVKKDGEKSDVEETEPDAHEQAIAGLAHNQALAGHPVFG